MIFVVISGEGRDVGLSFGGRCGENLINFSKNMSDSEEDDIPKISVTNPPGKEYEDIPDEEIPDVRVIEPDDDEVPKMRRITPPKITLGVRRSIIYDFLRSYTRFVFETIGSLNKKFSFTNLLFSLNKKRKQIVDQVNGMRFDRMSQEDYEGITRKINNSLQVDFSRNTGKEIYNNAKAVVDHFRGKQFVDSKKFTFIEKEFGTSDSSEYVDACKLFYFTSLELLREINEMEEWYKNLDAKFQRVKRGDTIGDSAIMQEVHITLKQCNEFDKSVLKYLTVMKDSVRNMRKCKMNDEIPHSRITFNPETDDQEKTEHKVYRKK